MFMISRDTVSMQINQRSIKSRRGIVFYWLRRLMSTVSQTHSEAKGAFNTLIPRGGLYVHESQKAVSQIKDGRFSLFMRGHFPVDFSISRYDLSGIVM